MFKFIIIGCLLLSSLTAAPYGDSGLRKSKVLGEVLFDTTQPDLFTTTASYGESYSKVETTTAEVFVPELTVTTTASYGSQAPQIEFVEPITTTTQGYYAAQPETTTTVFIAPMLDETTTQAYYAPETTALPPRIELDTYNAHFTAPPPMIEFETTTASYYSQEETSTVFVTQAPMLEEITTQSYYAAPETTTFFVPPPMIEQTTQSYRAAPQPVFLESTTVAYATAAPPTLTTTAAYTAAPVTTSVFVAPPMLGTSTHGYGAAPALSVVAPKISIVSSITPVVNRVLAAPIIERKVVVPFVKAEAPVVSSYGHKSY